MPPTRDNIDDIKIGEGGVTELSRDTAADIIDRFVSQKRDVEETVPINYAIAVVELAQAKKEGDPVRIKGAYQKVADSWLEVSEEGSERYLKWKMIHDAFKSGQE